MTHNIIQQIEQSTYSVSINKAIIPNFRGGQIIENLYQIGTAFAITENKLLTAQHVIEHKSENGLVELRNTTYDKFLLSKIIDEDIEIDLALLEVLGEQKLVPLPISSTIPTIGHLVLWGGYPRLIGEDIPLRFRSGSGQVASHSYQRNSGEFFEVDGSFNRSLSGGPLFYDDEKKVVGVVNASAGNPERFLEKLRKYKEKLEHLSYISAIGSGSKILTSFTFRNKEPNQIAKILFDELGLKRRSIIPVVGNPDHCNVDITLSEPIVAAIKILNDMLSLLEISEIETYQMGIGIVSGGKGLESFLAKNELDI